MSALVALAGNAMTGLDRSARAKKPRAAYEHVAEPVEADHEVVITQGNVPRKNEPAAADQSRFSRLSLPEATPDNRVCSTEVLSLSLPPVTTSSKESS